MKKTQQKLLLLEELILSRDSIRTKAEELLQTIYETIYKYQKKGIRYCTTERILNYMIKTNIQDGKVAIKSWILKGKQKL